MNLRILVSLLLLAPFVFSFSIGEYLYSNERLDSLRYENFTYGGVKYVLVRIDSKEMFLLKGGEPVRNETEIRNAIYTHYKTLYYPSEGEINEITSLVREYNNSRNDGGIQRGKEENLCRQALLLNGIRYGNTTYYCTDTQSCDKIGRVFYTAQYTEAVRQTMSYEKALAQLAGFANAVYSNDAILDTAFALISNLNEDSINSTYATIKSGIPQLRKNKEAVESSLFRTPRRGDTVDRQKCISEACVGLCLDFNYSASALDRLDAQLGTALTKVSPFANYRAVASGIYSGTETRLAFKQGEDLADRYYAQLEPLKSEATKVIVDGDKTAALINDQQLNLKLTRLKELNYTLNRSILSRNFSTIDEDISEFRVLTNETRGLIPKARAIYDSSLKVKNEAEATIFILDSSDLEEEYSAKLTKLKSASGKLDESFTQGLTREQYLSFKDAYSTLAKESKELLEASKSTPLAAVNLKFRAFARKINNGFASLLSTAGVSDLTVISQNKLAALGGFSVFTFLSLSAFAIIIFLKFSRIFSRLGKFATPVFFVVLLLLISGILVFSAALYFFMDRTSTDSNIEEFIIDISKKENLAIAVDLEGAGAVSGSMKSCASSIADSLKVNQNKTAVMYELADSSCTVNGEAKDRLMCDNQIANSSVVILSYTVNGEEPSFSTVYNTKAYFIGDEKFYNSCSVAKLFG